MNEWSSDVLVDILGIGTINRWAGFLCSLAFVFGILIRGRLRSISTIQISLILFAVWGIFSYMWSDWPGESGGIVFTYFSNIVFLIIISQYVSTEYEVSPLYAAFLLGTMYLGLALLEYKLLFTTFLSGGSIEYSSDGRFTLFGNNENQLAFGFVLAVPLAWYMAIRQERPWHKYFSWLFIPVASLGVLLTGSRAGLLALSLCFTIILVGPLFTAQRKRSMSFVFVLFLLFLTQSDRVSEYGQTTVKRLEAAVEGNANKYGEADSRELVWEAGLRTFFADTPRLLTGCGLGAFRWYVPPINGKRFVSHNTYVGVIVELGLIGIFLLFFILFNLFWSLKYLDGTERVFWIAIFGSWMLYSMFGNSETSKNTWLFFGIYASRVAYLIQSKEARLAYQRLHQVRKKLAAFRT